MGTPWCAKLPLVKVARTAIEKPVTIVMPYYDNAGFLVQQLEGWCRFPPAVKASLSAVIVDDCSPAPASDVLKGQLRPFPIRLFRIEKDVRWNWLAARNIGAHAASEGWVFLTDMDHVLPPETASALVYGLHDPKVVYGFNRVEHTGARILPHSASFFMTRSMFWKVGGYDERCSGFYGSDGLYRRRLAQTAPIQILTDDLVRHEFVGDSSTRTYKRKQPQDAGLRRLVATFPPNSPPTTLSFPYHEVAL